MAASIGTQDEWGRNMPPINVRRYACMEWRRPVVILADGPHCLAHAGVEDDVSQNQEGDDAVDTNRRSVPGDDADAGGVSWKKAMLLAMNRRWADNAVLGPKTVALIRCHCICDEAFDEQR